MIIYLGGNDFEYQASGYETKGNPPARLMSYFYVKDSKKKRGEMKRTKGKLFLDSGAFSAWNSGKKIVLGEYIRFIKKYGKYIDNYAGLDVIGDPDATLENLARMNKAGLKALPCFHFREDTQYLEYYIETHDHIALGGMVHASKRKRHLFTWLDKIFTKFICDDRGFPKVQVHGFGIASLDAMLRYPWYSIDTTTWGYASRMGEIMVPKQRGGEYVYNVVPSRIVMTETTTSKKNNFVNLSPTHKEQVVEYCTQKGWEIKKLKNDIVARAAINIEFFQNFGDSLPYPKPMLILNDAEEEEGFGLE